MNDYLNEDEVLLYLIENKLMFFMSSILLKIQNHAITYIDHWVAA